MSLFTSFDRMKDHPISRTGRWLLNRREFLRRGGTGLGAVALLSLLAEERLLGGGKLPIRPEWSSERPYAPRRPHFTAAAKNVLVIFCSGACSHLDTWDYKPELFRRHGEPLPGPEKLVTFQGENGNLSRPPWDFKARFFFSSRRRHTRFDCDWSSDVCSSD